MFSSVLNSFSWGWDGIISDPQDFGEVSEKLRHKVRQVSTCLNLGAFADPETLLEFPNFMESL